MVSMFSPAMKMWIINVIGGGGILPLRVLVVVRLVRHDSFGSERTQQHLSPLSRRELSFRLRVTGVKRR